MEQQYEQQLLEQQYEQLCLEMIWGKYLITYVYNGIQMILFCNFN